MNPAQRNKVDISKMTEEEQRLFRMYGKLPSRKDILSNRLKERKYFDSGDHALSQAGKASIAGVMNVGTKHATPEDIPHSNHQSSNASSAPMAGSPVKSESTLKEMPASASD
jgi:hypothetical protein